MKNKGPIVFFIALFVTVAAGYLVDAYIQSGIRARVAADRAKAAEAQVVTLGAEISKKNAAIAERDGLIASDRAAAAEREKKIRAQLEKVRASTPTQLADQGSEILGVSDITTDGATVTMSVETYRKIVFRLVEHKEYIEVKEPSWNAREALYEAQIVDLKSAVASHEKKDILNAGIISDLRSVIKNQKTMAFFEKAAWTAGGFAAGVIFGKI